MRKLLYKEELLCVYVLLERNGMLYEKEEVGERKIERWKS